MNEPTSSKLTGISSLSGEEQCALLGTIFAHDPSVLFFLDPSCRIRAAGTYAASLTGLEPAKLIGRQAAEVLPGAMETLAVLSEEIRRTGMGRAAELSFGAPVAVRCRAAILPVSVGERFLGWLLVTGPRTGPVPLSFPDEGAVAETAVSYECGYAAVYPSLGAEMARGEAAEIIEHLGEGFLVLDRDWRYVYINRGAEEILGRPRADLLGRAFRDDFSAALGDRFAGELRRAAETQTPTSCESYSSHLRRWLESTIYPSPRGLSVFIRDITARKETEAEREEFLLRIARERHHAEELAAALARERDALQAIMENSRARVAYLDAEFHYVRVNSAFAAGAGLPAEELIGRNHFDLFPDAETEQIFRRVRETGQAVSLHAHPVKGGREGGAAYWDWGLVPVGNAAGWAQGFVLSLLDVTEEVAARQRLEDALAAREASEQALRQSERRFRLLADNARDVVYRIELRPRQRFAYVSPAVYAMTGYTPEEHYRDPDLGLKIVHPEDRPILSEIVAGRMSGQPVTLRWMHKDGALIWTEQINTPIRDETGALVAIEGIARDITERKLVEEALRASEERLQLALSAADLGTWRYDPRTELYIAGANLNRILGRPPLESLEPLTEFLALIHPEDRSAVEARIRAAAAGGEAYEAEYRAVRPDGVIRWLRDRGRPIEAVNAAPPCLTGAVADITDLKRAEEERKQLLEELDTQRLEAERQAAQMGEILENLREGVTVIDAGGRVILRNRTAREGGLFPLSGIAAGDGRTPRLCGLDGSPLPPEDFPLVRLLRGEHFTDSEYILETPGSARRRVLVTGRTVRDDEDHLELAIITHHDVTELRNLEQSRLEYLRLISHELRQPLTVIMAQAQLVDRVANRPERVRQGIKAVTTTAWRMNAMIQDLVDSVRLESGQLRLKTRVVDLAAVIGDLLERIGEAVDVGRIRVNPPEEPHLVYADLDRLERILTNLLTNALKYSDPDTEVTVSFTRQRGEVITAVKDRGRGIAPEELPHLFERYYRAPAVRDIQEGLGLGLYITKGLVEAHGGRIWVETEPGRGSVFSFSLPASPSAGEENPQM
ncbi:MAG: PAS domain S-box protein [Bacteroidota bacterium]